MNMTKRMMIAAGAVTAVVAAAGIIAGCSKGGGSDRPYEVRIYQVPAPGPSAGDIDDINRLDRLNRRQDASLNRK